MRSFLAVCYSLIKCPHVPLGQGSDQANKRDQAATQAECNPVGLLHSLCVFCTHLLLERDDGFLNDDINRMVPAGRLQS